MVQGDQTGDRILPDLIKSYLKITYNKPGNVFCGVIHRLDRPTTGIVLFARTSKGLERMNKAFKERQTVKKYWAVVEGAVAENASLVHYLKKNPKNNKATVFSKATEGAKRAELTFEVVTIGERYTLVEVTLGTGRHHQIRAQLAAWGHPIKGDVKYGARRGERDRSICLHARSLGFDHPTTKEPISIVAEAPESFRPFL